MLQTHYQGPLCSFRFAGNPGGSLGYMTLQGLTQVQRDLFPLPAQKVEFQEPAVEEPGAVEEQLNSFRRLDGSGARRRKAEVALNNAFFAAPKEIGG